MCKQLLATVSKLLVNRKNWECISWIAIVRFCGDILYWHGKTFFRSFSFYWNLLLPLLTHWVTCEEDNNNHKQMMNKEEKEHKYFLQTIFSVKPQRRRRSHMQALTQRHNFLPPRSHLFYLFSFVKDFINNKRHSASPEMVSIDNEKLQKSQNHKRRKKVLVV